MNSYEEFMKRILRDAGAFQNIARTGEILRKMTDRMAQPMIANIGRQLDGASFGLSKIAANLPTNTVQLALGKALRESFAFKMPPLLQMPTPAALLGLQDSVNAIAKSIDFGRLVDLSSIAEKMRAALLRALPPNWPEDIDLFEVVDLLDETGLPVVWVPRGEIVASLVQAPDTEARDRILLEREEDVLGDIREVLAEIGDDELSDAVTAVMQALSASSTVITGPPRRGARRS